MRNSRSNEKQGVKRIIFRYALAQSFSEIARLLNHFDMIHGKKVQRMNQQIRRRLILVNLKTTLTCPVTVTSFLGNVIVIIVAL